MHQSGAATTPWSATNTVITTGRWIPYTGVYLPVLGFRSYNDGVMGSVGSYGDYWGSTPNSADLGYHLSFYPANMDPSYSNNRTYGLSVRCVSE
jgi:hypothetical protein